MDSPSDSESEDVVTATPGDDVTLQCRAPADADIRGVEWTRSDLGSDDYVFFLRGTFQPEHYQHESYRGRVRLLDPELTDGDASVILRNVSENDTGTYECEVFGDERRSRSSVGLQVTEPGVDQPRGHLGAVVPAVLVFLLLLLWSSSQKIWRQWRWKRQRLDFTVK